MRHQLDRHPGGCDQACLAHHPREQVVRRDLHRPQPEQLPVADAAPAGRPPHELRRHRSLQHGQLHLAGVRPVPVLRHPGRLLDVREHDQQQQRDHHDRHRRYRDRHRPDHRRQRHQHHRAEPGRSHQRQLRAAPHPRRCRRHAPEQRLRVPDRRDDRLQPVQRSRRHVEGLRPGSRRRPARRGDDLRDRGEARRQRHRARARGRVLRLPRHLGGRPGHQPHQPGGPGR